MDYKIIDLGSYNLHLIKTNRFKTLTIRVCLRDKVVKEEITLRNALSSFLTYSTDTYQTKRDFELHSQDLYVASISGKTYRSGTHNMINFYLTILNEKYTEKGMLEESIKFFSDVLFNPNFNNIVKAQEAFDYLYKSGKSALMGLKENPTAYSMLRMLESMGTDEPFSYRDIGYLEDLEKITLNDLIDYYKKVLNSSLVDIYIIGDFNEKTIVSLMKKYMKFNTFKRPKINQIFHHKKMPRKIKILREPTSGQQSKLSIGCKISDLSEFEMNYVLTLYNLLLGGSSESKFFQVIREKNSLAYYVSSYLHKLDHLLLIRAGISKENFEKVLKLIKKLMKDMEQGKISDEEIETAKIEYISRLKEIEDNSAAITETFIAKDVLNLGDIEERKKEIMKVTCDDLIRVAKKIKIDTVFLLEGDGSDEGN